MTFYFAVLMFLGGCATWPVHCEIRDVLKSAEIDSMFARTTQELAAHEMPNYGIYLEVRSKAGRDEIRGDADEVLFIRQGTASIMLRTGAGSRQYDLGAGDMVNILRNTSYRINPKAGRLQYIVVRIFPSGEKLPPRTGILSSRRMPEVVKRAEIDATFANSESNQPLHSAPNFTMNYVIYSGHSGPWEAHRGCVDIYFLHTGTGHAQLGGDIADAKEESPGEIRGSGVSRARSHNIGSGDIVVIPRNVAHHMTPTSGKLGYLLLKVWAE